MRLYFWIKAITVTLSLCVSGVTSAAMYTKTPTMPPTATVLSSGTPNLASNILEVGMPGVELIPSAASESRAVANMTKGLRVPTSGIVSGAKNLLKGNLASLAVTGAIAGLVAGVDWVMTDGVLMKKTTGLPAAYDGSDSMYHWTNAFQTTLYSSASDACDGFQARFANNDGAVSNSLVSSGDTFLCTLYNQQGQGVRETYLSRSGSSCPSNTTYSSSTGACLSSGGTSPVSDADFDVLDGFVQGKDGVWQQGLANEVCKNSSDFDSCVANMGAKPYISGPLSVSSPEVTTQSQTQNADGTSTEVTTKTRTDYSLGYPTSSPGTITIDPKTVTTTTTTTKDSTGNVTGTNTSTGSQSTTQEGEGTAVSDGTFTDTPFPDVGPFYTQKYPDGFKGVWDKNKDAFMQSDFIKFLEGFVPTFSGTCPTFGLSFDIMAHANYGYVSFWSMCWIFDIIKTIMLVTAMFTCRALIFGG